MFATAVPASVTAAANAVSNRGLGKMPRCFCSCCCCCCSSFAPSPGGCSALGTGIAVPGEAIRTLFSLLAPHAAERRQRYCLGCSFSKCPPLASGLLMDFNIIGAGTGEQGEKQPQNIRRSFLHIIKSVTNPAPELLWNKRKHSVLFPSFPSFLPCLSS